MAKIQQGDSEVVTVLRSQLQNLSNEMANDRMRYQSMVDSLEYRVRSGSASEATVYNNLAEERDYWENTAVLESQANETWEEAWEATLAVTVVAPWADSAGT